ncbi:hypothetical protein [Mariniflexile maritimum]|nr:hypothetical protein [Mariniflexile maritimum]HMQ45421.1 hypothetical protein [Mariniflexile sp.]
MEHQKTLQITEFNLTEPIINQQKKNEDKNQDKKTKSVFNPYKFNG